MSRIVYVAAAAAAIVAISALANPAHAGVSFDDPVTVDASECGNDIDLAWESAAPEARAEAGAEARAEAREEAPGGGVVLRFKRPWSDGTTGLRLTDLDLERSGRGRKPECSEGPYGWCSAWPRWSHRRTPIWSFITASSGLAPHGVTRWSRSLRPRSRAAVG